ncbi:MAG: hypothetical protein QG610_1825 [Euryarchaeota archaeon]|nr:hypothetical protein [Euryarchaeota archaeon]
MLKVWLKIYAVNRGRARLSKYLGGFHMNRLTTLSGDKFITLNNKLILEIRITYGEQPPLR